MDHKLGKTENRRIQKRRYTQNRDMLDWHDDEEDMGQDGKKAL